MEQKEEQSLLDDAKDMITMDEMELANEELRRKKGRDLDVMN